MFCDRSKKKASLHPFYPTLLHLDMSTLSYICDLYQISVKLSLANRSYVIIFKLVFLLLVKYLALVLLLQYVPFIVDLTS